MGCLDVSGTPWSHRPGVAPRIWREPRAGEAVPELSGHSLSLDVTSSNSSMSQRWGEGKRDPPGGPDHPQAGNALLRGLGARRELGTGCGGRSEGQELCPALGWSQPRSELQFIPEADGASGCVSRSLQDPFSKRLGLAGSLIDCLID